MQSEGPYLGEKDNELLKVDFLHHGELFEHLEHAFLGVTGETGDCALLYSQIVFLPISEEDAPRALFVGITCHVVEHVLVLYHLEEFVKSQMAVHIQVQNVEQYFSGFRDVPLLYFLCIDSFLLFILLQEIAADMEEVSFR